MFCHDCGTQMLATMRMCPSCGGKTFSSAPRTSRQSQSTAFVGNSVAYAAPPRVSFSAAISLFFKNYANFQGRSSRRAFWWWQLCAFLIGFAWMLATIALVQLGAVSLPPSTFLNLILFLYFLFLGFVVVVLVPTIALVVRRLHDSDKSGWWILLGFVPLAGIVVLIFCCLPGTTGSNGFGPALEAGTAP